MLTICGWHVGILDSGWPCSDALVRPRFESLCPCLGFLLGLWVFHCDYAVHVGLQAFCVQSLCVGLCARLHVDYMWMTCRDSGWPCSNALASPWFYSSCPCLGSLLGLWGVSSRLWGVCWFAGFLCVQSLCVGLCVRLRVDYMWMTCRVSSWPCSNLLLGLDSSHCARVWGSCLGFGGFIATVGCMLVCRLFVCTVIVWGVMCAFACWLYVDDM